MQKKLCVLLILLLLLSAWLPSCAGKTDGSFPPQNDAPATEPSKPDSVEQPDSAKTEVDLMIFMGDLNMAGRGNRDEDIEVPAGHAYEFRAVSDPTKLYPMTPAFGALENREGGIDDGEQRTGSPIPSFCEAYYAETKTPVVAVCAAVGGVGIADWSAGGVLEDAILRLEDAKNHLSTSGIYTLRHIFMVWCHGETDAANGVTSAAYQSGVASVIRAMTERGVEQCFLIASGSRTDDPARMLPIREAGQALCRENGSAVMVSDGFYAISDELRAPDIYTQAGYCRVGANAGANAGRWVLSPTDYQMKDIRDPAEERDDFNGEGIDLPEDSFPRHQTGRCTSWF